jgi:DNA-binding response OmpR family regulator
MEVDIMEAGDIVETETMMNKNRPHLLILDLGKPIQNWLKFLEKVMSNVFDGHSLSVMATSSEPGVELREKMLQLGVNDYITKHEISFETFLPRIRRLIG